MSRLSDEELTKRVDDLELQLTELRLTVKARWEQAFLQELRRLEDDITRLDAQATRYRRELAKRAADRRRVERMKELNR